MQPSFKLVLLVGLGGFIGTVLRYLITHFINSRLETAFPFATLGINLLGCFVIGIAFALMQKHAIPQHWGLILATGICGGFTTFSAFSNETLMLMRIGQTGYAVVYVAASVTLGLMATFTAITIFR